MWVFFLFLFFFFSFFFKDLGVISLMKFRCSRKIGQSPASPSNTITPGRIHRRPPLTPSFPFPLPHSFFPSLIHSSPPTSLALRLPLLTPSSHLPSLFSSLIPCSPHTSLFSLLFASL